MIFGFVLSPFPPPPSSFWFRPIASGTKELINIFVCVFNWQKEPDLWIIYEKKTGLENMEKKIQCSIFFFKLIN